MPLGLIRFEINSEITDYLDIYWDYLDKKNRSHETVSLYFNITNSYIGRHLNK
jgi:hypothetical protein